MKYPQRKSRRLEGYDYRQNGAYYVTMCIQNRLCLLGLSSDGGITLNEGGQSIVARWQQIPQKFPHIELDYFALMPNHLHGIVVVHQENDKDLKPGLIAVLHWFKSASTNTYMKGVKKQGWLPFEGRLWQESYYDHIIRDETSLTRIRDYILNNPSKWHEDEYYR